MAARLNWKFSQSNLLLQESSLQPTDLVYHQLFCFILFFFFSLVGLVVVNSDVVVVVFSRSTLEGKTLTWYHRYSLVFVKFKSCF